MLSCNNTCPSHHEAGPSPPDTDLVNQTEALSVLSCDLFLDYPSQNLIDTVPALSNVIDTLERSRNEENILYVDLEGNDLSRHDTLSLMQICVLPTKSTYMIDVHVLGSESFSTRGESGVTLRNILEDEGIQKVFFDVRDDSDALFSHFGIRLAGVIDLQLMELATRSFRRHRVIGLAACIKKDAPISVDSKNAWREVKEKGRSLFLPNEGGRYTIFDERPLPDSLLLYCAQDVQILPHLWSYYDSMISDAWRERVIEESMNRVTASHSSSYDGHSAGKTFVPPGWEGQPHHAAKQQGKKKRKKAKKTQKNKKCEGIPKGGASQGEEPREWTALETFSGTSGCIYKDTMDQDVSAKTVLISLARKNQFLRNALRLMLNALIGW